MSTGADTAEPVDLMPGKSAFKKAREVKPKSILPRPKSLAMPPLPFFKWMAKFTDEQKGRATLSVYRDWPVIDKKLTDASCKRPRLIAWFGDGNPMPIENPNEWADFFLKNPEWGGSGEYKCICNEVGLHGAIALTHFKFKDSEYPPVVDPAIVVQGHPDNKGYLDGLRARGIPIPGENTNEEKDMNVAAQLVDTVTKTNERLMDRIEELQEEQTEEQPIEENITQAAVKHGFELVSNASKSAMEVVTEQNKRLAAATSPDPLELLKSAKELFSPATAAKSDDTTMQIFGLFMQNQRESLNTVQTMHKDTLDFMQKMEDKREAAATVAQTQPQQNGMTSVLEQMTQIKQVAEMFGMKSGRREIEAPPVTEPARPWYQSYVENPMLMFTGIALLQGLAGSILNRNAPQKSVADTIREAQEAGKSMMQSVTQPPAPSPQEQQAKVQAQAQQFLKLIEPTFLAHFFDQDAIGYSGFTFAAELRAIRQDANTGQVSFVPGGPETQEGVSTYRNIKNGGPEQFDRLIQGYPPIWQMVQGNRPKYIQFLQEFFSFEEESAKQPPPSQASAGVQ